MRFVFIFVFLCAHVFAKGDPYKNYGYLSLGISGTKEIKLPESQQLGLGYRIHHKKKFFIDASDISISMLSNKTSTNTYSQSIFPKVIFLHHMTKTRPLYVGIGAAYLKAEIEQTKEHFIGGSPVKIRETKKLRDITASFAIGKIIFQSPSIISFAQCEINVPSKSIVESEEYRDFIGVAFTMNAGF